jgi:hypothetical protein
VITTLNPDKLLYRIVVLYNLPGTGKTDIHNVMGYRYDSDPDRLVVHHDRDQLTEIMAGCIRLVHVTVQ